MALLGINPFQPELMKISPDYQTVGGYAHLTPNQLIPLLTKMAQQEKDIYASYHRMNEEAADLLENYSE